MNPKVSFVCTSYRRYRCVERIIEQYLQQDYQSKELIIFNTDTENPMSLDESLFDYNIILVNNSIDYITGLEYTNRGQICRDAVSHATGDLFMLADDDDIYLPWHLRQAVDGIESNGKDAWKPRRSFFATPTKLEMCQNTLEASVIVKMHRIREIGFRDDLTGYEGLSWYTKLRDEKQLDEYNEHFIPSYCFNWSDPSDMAGHKQSGDINNPNNFENHKQKSCDVSSKPLERLGESIKQIYQRYYNFLLNHKSEYDIELWQKYASKYVDNDKKLFDYVEIGTSDFDISDGSIDLSGNGKLDPDKTYLLVEPIGYYLDRLPSGDNIYKANYAISDEERIGKMFYLSPENIKKLNFPYWAKGCNKLDKKHPTIEKDLERLGHSSDLIESCEVKCITFKKLIEMYDIRKIGKLAIDTEGHDHLILKGVVECIKSNKIEIDVISFEVGFFDNSKELDELYKQISHIYPVVKFNGANKIISKV